MEDDFGVKPMNMSNDDIDDFKSFLLFPQSEENSVTNAINVIAMNDNIKQIVKTYDYEYFPIENIDTLGDNIILIHVI